MAGRREEGDRNDLVRAFIESPLPKEMAFPKIEYRNRLSRVRTAMDQAGLDMLLVHTLPNICYLTGYQTPMADWYNCLLVPIEGDLTLQACSIGLAVAQSHVTDLHWARWDDMEEAAEQLVRLVRAPGRGIERLGVETRRPGLTPYVYEQLAKAFSPAQLRDATALVPRVRAIKSRAEVECLRRAARFTVAGAEAAIAAIGPGATENDIAASACEAMIRAGGEFFAIDPHIRVGRRSSMAHGTFKPKFPLPQEGMALISLTKASVGARVFWLQGEGDSEQIEGALLQRGGRGGLVELDRRV